MHIVGQLINFICEWTKWWRSTAITSRCRNTWLTPQTRLDTQPIPSQPSTRHTCMSHLPLSCLASSSEDSFREGVVLGPHPNMCFARGLEGSSSDMFLTQMQSVAHDSLLLTCLCMNAYRYVHIHMPQHEHLLMTTMIGSWLLMMWTDIWYTITIYRQIDDHDLLIMISLGALTPVE